MPKRLLPFAYGFAALLFAVLALAWFDGGVEDLREIAVPVPLPESVK